MDDAQRTMLGGCGAGLMLGGVAWIAATAAATPWPWPARVFPAGGMFLVGVAVLVWAWPGQNSWWVVKKEALKDAKALLAVHDLGIQADLYRDWSARLYLKLIRIRPGFATQVQLAGEDRGPIAEVVEAKIALLESLPRWTKTIRRE
jgi:hypothetical protein